MKLWGGRFSGPRDPFFEKFSESFSQDRRLIDYDLRVNQAYVQALGRARVLKGREVRALERGLRAIARHVARRPRWADGAQSEDVHTWVEAQLVQTAGPVAHKLRTGRSRNDLIATEMRWFVKDAARSLSRAILEMLEALVQQARRHRRAILPGHTHFQPAQPILFSHYLLAYFEMLVRDLGRLEDCRARADELPLGAGALAGTAYTIDRDRLAKALGFARAARNSLDVTSDRDFVCELVFACALALAHLSRWAEDLILYSHPALGYVELADAYATGSSLMPQKKNADALELIRAKAARVTGKLAGLLTLLKGLPLAYNRDLQEDKPALFDAVDTTRDCLRLAARVMRTLHVHPQRMKRATEQGFLTATDAADALVRRGVPFARAHEQLGRLVRYCLGRQATFAEISDAEAKRFIPLWDGKLRAVAISPEFSVERKRALGGTAPRQVARQIARCRRITARLAKDLERGG